MNDPAAGTMYDATPEAALEALRSYQGPVLLDLDETLYLRNSTEDFLDTVRPAVLALLLLRALDALRPWRWSGGEATRDTWRVLLVCVCFPWALHHWRRRSAALGRRYGNRSLISAVQARGSQPIVATIGFRPIVRPLLAALGLADAVLVSVRPFNFADRRHGKLALATRELGADTVHRGLVLTDSLQDLPLLGACARPLRTVWPHARYRPALSGVYLPGQYLSRIKRPGERYILRGILQEDFAFWLLGSLALAEMPLLHVLGLLLLLLSFWAIYERGYVDNDLIAARYEQSPKLSAEFHLGLVPTPRWQPWIWAAGSAAAALLALRWPGLPTPFDALCWAAVLLGTHAWFLLYNRYDKATRVWLFAGLQLARSAAFAVLVPVVPSGALALGAHVLARWTPYYFYRSGSRSWPDAPMQLTRLLFFVLLLGLMALARGSAAWLDWSAAALFAWNLYRALPQLRSVCSAAQRLDRPARRAADKTA